MTTRETMLRDIRRNLGRAPGAPPPALLPPRLSIPSVSKADRIESMLRRVSALAGKTLHAHTAAEAVEYVQSVTQGVLSVASNSAYLSDIGITSLPGVRSGITDEAQLRRLCATASCGITSATYALADTGSLVMIAARNEARLVSLLPPVHIAVLPTDKILTSLDELYTLEPKPADNTSSMVLITGPSRTADIEQILVRGVHGPGEIHVVVVDA